MKIEHVEIFVEEPSMEAALVAILPSILGRVTYQIYVYQGKGGLLKRLPNRLQGYARTLPDSWCILVLVDRDNEDCKQLKEQLEKIAHNVGLQTRSMASGGSFSVVNRIVIEELEAWYFGDWEAVSAAYPGVPSTIPSKSKYRYPDQISGGTKEAFERVLKKAGYFKGGLQQIGAAQAISMHMVPDRNTSPSFKALLGVLREFNQS